MESVCNVEEVGVDEANRLRYDLLDARARVKDELDPALGTLMSNVVLQWSSNLALARKSSVDEAIQESGLKSRHCFYFFKIYYN